MASASADVIFKRRLGLVFLLTLLPWPAVWLGMYRLHSLVWTFVLYHGVCLLPAVIWGRRLWLPAVRLPTRGQVLLLVLALATVLPLVPLGWTAIGTRFVSPEHLLAVVTARGFRAAWLLPLGIYFVPVNAILEELFWRGVILNELRGAANTASKLGVAWAICAFGGGHYLVLRLLLRPGWAEASVLLIAVAGAFLAWLYRATRSIVLPVLWHGLIFDLAVMIAFGAALRIS